MNPKILLLAQGIAIAEGFGGTEHDGSPNLPSRCNNPGDLEIGDVGYGTEMDKTIFPTEQAGWTALEHECDLVLNGLSRAGYKTSDTFLQFAQRYTGGDGSASWAQIVCHHLGISVTDTLKSYYTAAS